MPLQLLSYLILDLQVIFCLKLHVIFCGNLSLIHITTNPVFQELTNRLEIGCHIVRDTLQGKIVKLLPISSKDQTGDFFT